MTMIAALKNKNTEDLGLELLKEFIEKERLTRSNFSQLNELLSITACDYRNGRISKQDIAELNISFGLEFLQSTLHGRGYLKPNGYSGDYLFLDKIYTNYVSENPKYKIWDEFVQQNGAPSAVRNRKEYFKHFAKSKANSCKYLNILNIVSGSGRELAELYGKMLKHGNVKTTCVELDEEAIRYSKELNKNHLSHIEYINSNIFKFKTEEKFDFIWSAGLFDYLNDRTFIMLLKRFKEWQKKGSEIIIGNFNEAHNPSRHYMEILGDWHLIHRTEEQLLGLARAAGFKSNQIRVNRMPDNMILYLHIQTI